MWTSGIDSPRNQWQRRVDPRRAHPGLQGNGSFSQVFGSLNLMIWLASCS